MVPCASPGCSAEFPSGRAARGHLAVCAFRVWPIKPASRASTLRTLPCGHLTIQTLGVYHDVAACRAALDRKVDVALGRIG